MKSYPNIERSGAASQQYIGYSADGRAWHITGRSGYWTARAFVTSQGSLSLLLGYERLAELSTELASIGARNSQ